VSVAQGEAGGRNDSYKRANGEEENVNGDAYAAAVMEEEGEVNG